MFSFGNEVVRIEMVSILVCRVCLQTLDEGTLSIYEKDSSDTICVYEKIEYCSGIKILNDSELPTRICKNCIFFLSIAYKFRLLCRNSDKYIREYLCKTTRIQDNYEQDEKPSYLFDTNINDKSIVNNPDQETQSLSDDVPHDNLEYEEFDNYTELWLEDEDEIIEEIEEEEKVQSTKNLSPSKTLGISSDGAAVICVKSGKQYFKEKTSQVHICDICGNTYPRKYALEAHMRRHRNERPYTCELCNESFHLNFQLTRHIRKHTGARPYACQYCKRSFADRSTMVKHERIHRNERPYTCETCGKNFTYSSVLKVHQLTHTGEKPFNCGICGKRFSRAHHLRAHLETLLHQNDPRAKILLGQIKRDNELPSSDDFIQISN